MLILWANTQGGQNMNLYHWRPELLSNYEKGDIIVMAYKGEKDEKY